jgi:large subunit ribosomal protein L9
MKVIFLEDVQNVAKAGEVKNVADGFSSNYLIPKKLAVLATKAELKKWEAQQEANSRREARIEQEAESVAKALNDTTVVLKARAGEQDRIYGSITNADVAEALEKATGHAIDKRKIELDEPIRVVGSRQVTVKLARNVTAEITVVVEKEQEE